MQGVFVRIRSTLGLAGCFYVPVVVGAGEVVPFSMSIKQTLYEITSNRDTKHAIVRR